MLPRLPSKLLFRCWGGDTVTVTPLCEASSFEDLLPELPPLPEESRVSYSVELVRTLSFVLSFLRRLILCLSRSTKHTECCKPAGVAIWGQTGTRNVNEVQGSSDPILTRTPLGFHVQLGVPCAFGDVS